MTEVQDNDEFAAVLKLNQSDSHPRALLLSIEPPESDPVGIVLPAAEVELLKQHLAAAQAWPVGSTNVVHLEGASFSRQVFGQQHQPSLEAQRVFALHEAGHIAAGWCRPDFVAELTMVRAWPNGMTRWRRDGGECLTVLEQFAYLVMTMGGCATEQLDSGRRVNTCDQDMIDAMAMAAGIKASGASFTVPGDSSVYEFEHPEATRRLIQRAETIAIETLRPSWTQCIELSEDIRSAAMSEENLAGEELNRLVLSRLGPRGL